MCVVHNPGTDAPDGAIGQASAPRSAKGEVVKYCRVQVRAVNANMVQFFGYMMARTL